MKPEITAHPYGRRVLFIPSGGVAICLMKNPEEGFRSQLPGQTLEGERGFQ